MLLEAGADVTIKSNKGETPMDVAIKGKNIPVQHILKDHAKKQQQEQEQKQKAQEAAVVAQQQALAEPTATSKNVVKGAHKQKYRKRGVSQSAHRSGAPLLYPTHLIFFPRPPAVVMESPERRLWKG